MVRKSVTHSAATRLPLFVLTTFVNKCISGHIRMKNLCDIFVETINQMLQL